MNPLHGMLLLTVTTMAALPAKAQRETDDPSATPSVLELAAGAGGFTTLVQAVTEAGLVEPLSGDGPFTVFAPTDGAFAKLPEGTLEALLRPENRETLTRILAFHVVAGEVDAVSALAAGTAETLAGKPLEIDLAEGQLLVQGAKVVANDLAASNGVVHAIDTVLLPPEDPAPAPERAALALLGTAIERGVPLFNEGQPAACAAIYEIAAQAVVDLGADLPEESRAILRRALGEVATTRDPAARAWTLRYAIDEASLRIVRRVRQIEMEMETENATSGSRGATHASDDDLHPIFTFGPDEDDWFSVNDNVMGGISKGGYSRESGRGVFSGRLSLENNGGFSTIRSKARDLGLEGFDGVMLRVRGDGREYSFRAMTDGGRYGVRSWQKKFPTTAGEWTEVRVPFADLRLTVMGQRVPGAPPIEARAIQTLSFSIADKNESPFRLEIESIQAYRSSPGS